MARNAELCPLDKRNLKVYGKRHVEVHLDWSEGYEIAY